MTKRKSYSPEFKAKVVRELIEGDCSVGVIASKYHLNANLLSKWRKQLFDNSSVVFSQEQVLKENRKVTEDHRQEVDNLNRIIGELTVERDYLQRSLKEQFDRLGL